MRLFLAVELPADVRAAAGAAGAALRRAFGTGLDARWLPEEALHVTVWFFGELDEERAGALQEALRPPLAAAPFRLAVAGLGAFPPSGTPRVIWMGVRAGVEPLRAAHAELAVRLQPFGYEPERRPSQPHVTLARVRQPPAPGRARALRRVLAASGADAGTADVSALTLFRSRLSPRGAAYDALLRVPLGR